MDGPLSGVRVLEVAAWAFVPSAGAVLADWGATVTKVEPMPGDPLRGLRVGGAPSADASPINHMLEIANRGKRSVGLDISIEGGRAALLRLADESDVFLTSYLPATRRKLGIDVDDITARNPRIVYARGSGWGTRGPEAEHGGFDAACYGARGGITHALTPAGSLPAPARPAFGDIMSGMVLAGGIAAALLQRERTGEGTVVDVSLLGTALWNLAPDVTAARLYAGIDRPTFAPGEYPNPLSGAYRTADERSLVLVLLEGDRWWPELCARIGRTDLRDDPRYATMADRYTNRVDCCAELARTFAGRTLAEWTKAFDGFDGVWAPVATAAEVATDPQVLANDLLQEVTTEHGAFLTASSPVQFCGQALPAGAAPAHGAHTDAVLLEAGYDMDTIIELKVSGAVL